MIRALLALGIPFDVIQSMPIDIAFEIIPDERPNNTHPVVNPRKTRTENTQPSTSSTGTTYVATKRKQSKPKA